MRLIESITSWFQPKANSSSPLDDFWYNSLPYFAGAQTQVTPELAIRITAVYACVRVLSETIASLPFILYRRLENGGKERAPDHYLYELLRHQPNQIQTAFEFWEEAMVHCCLRGVFYARIIIADGRIQELIPIHPDRIRPEKLPTRRLRFNLCNQDGAQEILRQEEVFRVTLFTKSDGITPISPIEACANSVAISSATEIFARSFFENGSVPYGTLESDAKIQEETRKVLRESWERMHRGAKNANKIAILDQGLKFKSVSLTGQDTQLLESRQFNLSDICRIYRVPPHMIQDMSRSTFNNIEHQTLNFMIHTTRPWTKRFQHAVRRDLLLPAERETYFAEHLLIDVLSADAKNRALFYSKGILDGWMTRNEARGFENLNPLDGLDEPLQPLNMATQAEKDQMSDPDYPEDDLLEEDQNA